MCMVRAHMTWRRLLVLSSLIAGCGDSHSTAIGCTGTTSGTLSSGGAVTYSGKDDLNGAAIAATGDTTVPTGAVSIACAPDIAPDGFITLGPAVSFGTEGAYSDRPFELTLPYKAARLPTGARPRNVRIVAQRPGMPAYFPELANRQLDATDPYASRATFEANELTTYQLVATTDAGQTQTEAFTYNAVIGISMGGFASVAVAMHHPDKFDAFADMGGDPGASMIYTLGMVRDDLFGGFCTAADEAAGNGMVGQLCPNPPKYPGQGEAASDYEHMLTQSGDGVGLTLSRSFYMKAARDMSRALGNPALYNPSNAYAPPGVDFSFFAEPDDTRCATPTVLNNFYDREFNPDGAKPVITFCDGGDGPNLGLAVFDPSLPQTNPAEVLLAVDLNGNGVRDSGEPVITNAYEPFSDVGSDGLADKDEPGYDPVANPDPNHDDYDFIRNPLGTEGNGNYDQGEPFEDVGLDGVAGTCQAGDTPPEGIAGCYDYGEGNGKWDLSPNVARWYANDFNEGLKGLTPDQAHHMGMWFDAGIRDFFNNWIAVNRTTAVAMADGTLPFGVWDGFGSLVGSPNDFNYDFTTIDWDSIPKNNYLRYGDPDATADTIMMGDGRHVGTPAQAIYRIETAFSWIDHGWPGGDLTDSYDAGETMPDLTFTSPTTGRVSPFSLYLPPGYGDPENASATYPVVYVLHGYGQQPSDLVALSAVVANHMIASEPLETRIQKFIMVFVDGRCRPGSDGVPLPVDDTDGCEEGTFYTDAPLGGTARMETNLLDLMTYIDATYRTKSAASVDVVQ